MSKLNNGLVLKNKLANKPRNHKFVEDVITSRTNYDKLGAQDVNEDNKADYWTKSSEEIRGNLSIINVEDP